MKPWLTQTYPGQPAWYNGFDSIMPMGYWNSDGVNPSWCLHWLLKDYCAYCGHCDGCAVPVTKAQIMLDGYSHGTIIDPAKTNTVHRSVVFSAFLRAVCLSASCATTYSMLLRQMCVNANRTLS
jgi:hypothetical protein